MFTVDTSSPWLIDCLICSPTGSCCCARSFNSSLKAFVKANRSLFQQQSNRTLMCNKSCLAARSRQCSSLLMSKMREDRLVLKSKNSWQQPGKLMIDMNSNSFDGSSFVSSMFDRKSQWNNRSERQKTLNCFSWNSTNEIRLARGRWKVLLCEWWTDPSESTLLDLCTENRKNSSIERRKFDQTLIRASMMNWCGSSGFSTIKPVMIACKDNQTLSVEMIDPRDGFTSNKTVRFFLDR